MHASLVWITPDAEKIMSYCARVSSDNQNNPEYEKLLSYCIKHGHWSVFEMANMCIEINTSRAISAQILRHKSFNFQEFSQRYAAVNTCEIYQARRQDVKNRQNSVDDMSSVDKSWFTEAQQKVQNYSKKMYEEALQKGIAKEQARFLLPLSTSTKLYMSGSIRSWIHYLELRTANGTQKEHQDIALEIKDIFKEQLPTVAKSLGWCDEVTATS